MLTLPLFNTLKHSHCKQQTNHKPEARRNCRASHKQQNNMDTIEKTPETASIMLKTDIELRLFLLHFATGQAVQYIEKFNGIEATWQELTKRESERITAAISKICTEIRQMKYN